MKQFTFSSILTLSIALSSVLGQCQEGCLACDTKKDSCLLCDLEQGYQTLRGRCIYAQQKNCAIQNHKGNCLFCDKGYFVDSFTMTCVKSALAGTVENCSEYVVDNECYKCETGYYLTTKNTCVNIPSPITNCYIYASDVICATCETGYIISVTQDSCSSPPEIENCASFTPLNCVSCESGYLKNKNNYLYELLSFDSQRNTRLMETRWLLDQITMYRQSFDVCQAEIVENCAQHDEFNICVLCDTGYFLKNGNCTAYPLPKIYNCITYTGANTCVECTAGYYLSSSTTCAKVNYISDCITYDGTKSKTFCLECQMDYYLSEENVCTKRTEVSEIDYCYELDIKAELCNACEEDYTLTSDRKKCLPSIKNCATYNTSNLTFTQLECNSCENGYYYDLNYEECIEGSVEKCEVYYKNSNTCKTCINTYYLLGGVCKMHSDLLYCEKYSSNDKNACVDCNNVSFVFTQKNTCLQVDPIRNCNIYASVNTCDICDDGYELNDDLECDLIPTQEFCLQKLGDDCIKCLPNYVLEQGECHLPLFHLIQNCDDYNVDGLTDYANIKCNYCRQNFRPINYADSFVCYENKYLEDQLEMTLIQGCNQYKLINDVYQCYQCDQGFMLNEGTCIQGDSCPNSKTLLLQVIQQVDSVGDGSNDSFYIDKINECVDQINNCAVAAPDLNQQLTTISYSCIECMPNHLSIFTFNDDKVLTKKPKQLGDFPTLSPLSFTPSKTCEPKNTAKLLGEENNQEIPQCELYYFLTGFGYGCLKCEQGKTGIIVDAIHNCEIYGSLTTCLTCKKNYYPQTAYRCVKVNPVQDCIEYERDTINGFCTRCNDEYFLNANACSKRNQFMNNCDRYAIDSQDCEECEDDFILIEQGGNRKCVKEISGCDTYDFGTELCNVCVKTHFILEHFCYPGQVTNCIEYVYNPLEDLINKCEKCDNGFYLTINNTCVAQPAISDCEEFHSDQGYCKLCANNNFLFKVQNTCTPSITITNCATFKSIESCLRCDDGFYPVNYGQRCLAIPADKHCEIWGDINDGVSYDENNCEQCESGYLLVNKQCRLWFQAITEYCVQTNTNEDKFRKYAECEFCDMMNHLTLSRDISTDFGVCVEQSLLLEYKESEYIDYCKIYKYDTTLEMIVCQQCEENYYLLSNATTGDDNYQCVTAQECYDLNNGGYNVYLEDSLYGAQTANSNTIDLSTSYTLRKCTWSTAVIATKTAANKYCKSGLILTQTSNLTNSNNLEYGCIECPYEQYPYKVVSKLTSIKFALNPDPQAPTDKSYLIDSCKSQDLMLSNVIDGSVSSNGLIQNCEFYELFTNNYACIQCKMGYYGKVLDSGSGYGYIDKCEVFSDCDDTYTANLMNNDITRIDDYFNYGNDFHEINTYFAQCKKCSDSNKQLVVVIDNSGNLKEYSGAGGNGYNMGCFGTGDQVNAVGLGGMLTNCMRNIYVVGDNFYCVACKPGYYPTYDNTHKIRITACTAFNNCNNASYENICNECITDYYYLYNNTNDNNNNTIKYEYDCISYQTIDNCYAMNSASACVLCKMGYELVDIDGVSQCVLKSPAKCDSGINFKSSLFNTLIYYINYELATTSNVCETCSTGLHNVINYNEMIQSIIDSNQAPFFKTAPQICYLTDQQFYDENIPTPATSYTYCNDKYANYLLSDDINNMDIYCRECTVAGVITQDGYCVSIADNANCNIVLNADSNFCYECATGYTSVAGVCQQSTSIDAHCTTFADSSFTTGASCLVCEDKYYLEAKIQEGKYVTQCIDYYGAEDPSTTDILIRNCNQFNSDDLDRIYCIECEPTYALLILEGDSVDNEVGYNRVCIDVSTEMTSMNCSAIDLNAQKKGQIICTECKTDSQYFMEDRIQTSGDYLNFCVQWARDPNCISYDIDTELERVVESVTYSYNYLPQYSTLECLQCATGFYMDKATNLCTARTRTYNNNCQEYQIYQDYCKICDENYFLSSDKTTCDPAPIFTDSLGYIFSCKQMEECNTEINYSGLHPHLEAMISCHSCKQVDHIPFIAVSAGSTYDTITSLKEYSLERTVVTDPFSDYSGGRSVFCAEAVKETFGITDPLKFTFPTNCAIGILNVDSDPDATSSGLTTAIDRTKMAVFCGACKPGYYPTFGQDGNPTIIDFMIGSCTLISNCQESKAFNNCTKCNSGYAFDFVDGEVSYQVCTLIPTTPITNKDCFVYDSTNSKCIFCSEGTFLNADNFCERIQPPKCEYKHFQFNNQYDEINLSTGLYLNSKGTGCTRCQQGYSALYQSSDYWICTDSQVLSSNLLQTGSLYLKNCKNYTIEDNILRCKTCNSNYVVIESTGECTAMVTNLQHCNKAIDATYCQICDQGYVLVSRICVAQNIANCEEYYYTINSTQQICNECEEGYYLEANTCQVGDVENCLRFETKIVCNQCNDGFQLVKRNDGVSYCYPIDERLNCSVFDMTDFQSAYLNCSQCTSNMFVISQNANDFNYTHCLRFYEVNDCELYDIQPALGDSSFECIKCTEQFYLDDNSCVKRTNMPKQCEVYSFTTDVCQTCQDGYYANPTGSECIVYPTGIIGCEKYSNKFTCVQCETEKYLQGEYCLDVPDSNLIDNCVYYADDSTCNLCLDGYILNDNICNQIVAQNCETYESINACATCPDMYGFEEVDSIKNCISQSITNCIAINPVPDSTLDTSYHCLKCESGYYLSNSVCVQIETEILYCEIYESATTCSICQKGTALSLDKTSCLTNSIVMEYMDIHCVETQVLETPICNSCAPGYIFEEGVCVECITDRTKCYNCDPQDKSKCLMCNTGYMMTGKKECVKYISDDFDTIDEIPKENFEFRIVVLLIMILNFI